MRAMKDSQVEWLGDVPESWTVKPHWSVMRESKTPVGNLHTELDLLSLTKRGVIIRDLDGGGKFPASFESYQQVQVGDLILCLFDVEETPRTVGLAYAPGMITSAYTVMRISEVDPFFIEWYLIGMDNEKKFKPFYSGLRNTLSKDVFGSIRFAMPPLDEQKAIVSYLNQETTQIEELISKKEQLIERLLERRQALITHAVAKGLNPNAPLKDSKVDWLGKVPAHWSILPAKAVFRSTSTKAGDEEEHLTPSQKFGVLSQKDYMQVSGSRVVLQSTDSGNMKLVLPGDFISHLRSFQGGLEVSGLRGKVSGAYTVLRPLRKHDSGYFKWLLKSNMYVQGLQTTTDQLRDGQTIRMEQLKLLPLPFPELGEQGSIASFLDHETSQIDTLVKMTKKAIELLKERRQALITQVVTGKIDVRGFAGGNS